MSSEEMLPEITPLEIARYMAVIDAARALARLNCCPRDECACCEAHGPVIDAVRALDERTGQ